MKQTSKENLAEVGFEPTTSGLQVRSHIGASQKPYNLACRVTEDHTHFHRYSPESDTVGI